MTLSAGSEGVQESRTHLRDGGRRRLVFAALAALAGKAVIGGVGRAAAGSVGRAAAGSVAKTAATKGASGLLRQGASKNLLSSGGSGNWGPLVNKVKQGSQPQCRSLSPSRFPHLLSSSSLQSQSGRPTFLYDICAAAFWKRGSRSRGQSTASDLADEWDQPTRARSNSINEGKPKKWNLPEISGGFGGPSQETLNDYFGAGGGFLDGPPAWTKVCWQSSSC